MIYGYTRRKVDAANHDSLVLNIYEHDIENIEAQIKNGVDVNKFDEKSGTLPLSWAIVRNDRQIFSLLLDHGADINAVDVDGVPPISMAATCDNMDIAKILIAKKANIHVRDKNELTPLHHAIFAGHIAIAELLIDNGADPDDRIRDAALYTSLNIAVCENNKDAILLLLSKGADVNARIYNNATPLHTAVRLGNVDIAKLLISKGADIHIKDNDNNEPAAFIKIAEKNKEELRKLLDK